LDLMKKRSFVHSVPFALGGGTFLFTAAALLLSWRAEGLRVTRPAGAGTAGAAATSPGTAYLPAGDALAGWTPSAPPSVYTPKDLFELINGGADMYVEYGFRTLVHAEYRKTSDPKTTLAIDLYDMASPSNAFGIYTYERGDRPSNEAVGDEGILSSASLAFRRAGFYVKIETNDLSGATARAAKPLALRIADLIPGPPGKVAALDRFPDEGRVPGSARLVPRAPAGLESVGRAFLADYVRAGRKGTLFFSGPESAERGRADLEGLRKELETRWTVEARPGALSARGKESNEALVVREAGPHLIGIRGDLDVAEACKILDALQNNLGR
jgi:hypothetical protein